MAPSPHGPYWKKGQKVGYQDVGFWTILKSTPLKRLYAQFTVSKTGVGKTSLIKRMAGLLEPSEGRVLFDNHDVTGLTPDQRNIAQVFQFPVIYDTMSVFDNLAFPLRKDQTRLYSDGWLATSSQK